MSSDSDVFYYISSTPPKDVDPMNTPPTPMDPPALHREGEMWLRILTTRATDTLRAIMTASGDTPGEFTEKEADEHIVTGIRHASTALLRLNRYTPDDGEDHLALAITRLLMASITRDL